MECAACRKFNVQVTDWSTSCVTFPILKVILRDELGKRKNDWLPNANNMADILRPLDAAVCPHAGVNSPQIIQAYRRDCTHCQTGAEHETPHSCCHGSVRCKDCPATIVFESRMLSDKTGLLELKVTRQFDMMEGIKRATDSEWLTQLTQPDDFMDLKEAWMSTMERCPEPCDNADSKRRKRRYRGKHYFHGS